MRATLEKVVSVELLQCIRGQDAQPFAQTLVFHFLCIDLCLAEICEASCGI